MEFPPGRREESFVPKENAKPGAWSPGLASLEGPARAAGRSAGRRTGVLLGLLLLLERLRGALVLVRDCGGGADRDRADYDVLDFHRGDRGRQELERLVVDL